MSSIKQKLLVALSATAIAQIIHLAFTPILTRLYSPEDFGKLAILIAFLGILTAIGTARFDLAIIIANKDEQNVLDNIIRTICFILSLVILFVSLGLYLFGYTDYAILAFFLSFATFFRCSYMSKRAILNSFGHYKKMGIGRVLENTSNGVLGILLSYSPFKMIGLYLAKTFSLFVGYFYYLKNTEPLLKDVKRIENKSAVIKKYENFPKFTILSEFIIQLNLSISIFAFTSLYSTESAGYISLTTRVLSLPINFIGIAFLDVFKEKATEQFKKSGNCEDLFIKFSLTLFAVALPIIGIIHFFGGDLFSLVFGEEWREAGIYAQALVFMYGVRLLSSPLNFTFHLNDAQKQNLYMQVILFLGAVGSIYYAYKQGKSEIECIQIYAITLFICHLIYVLWSYKHSKGKTNNS